MFVSVLEYLVVPTARSTILKLHSTCICSKISYLCVTVRSTILKTNNVLKFSLQKCCKISLIVYFVADSNGTGTRHPLDTPPPRYVSVVALNEIEKSEKGSSPKHRGEIEVADDSGLPTYEEAVMQQEAEGGIDGAACYDVTTEGKRRKENVVKISMV